MMAILDPQARALLDLMLERGVPPVHTLSPADARRYYLERRRFTQPDVPEVGHVEPRTIAGKHGPIGLRLYRPPIRSEPGPALVYFHGGGWTIGDLDTHDVLCRQLCLGAGMTVASVDYRLGPEHRFPAAIDDALAAARWVRREAQALAIDGTRIALGGDSAGGNIAAVVPLLLRDAGEAWPAYQLLIYPATDMRCGAPSHRANGQGYLLTNESIAYYRDHYIADPAQWADWRASPLLAVDLRGLPPALVLTAGFDPLRDEGRQYADALSAAGNDVQYVCFERQLHGFITMGRVIDEANTAVDLCASVLRRALRA
jgi:acetyl esterase